MRLQLPAATYIDTRPALTELVDALCREPLLGMDTESNSLHAYRERVCLVQVSSRDADYIIDPLAIDDLSPLGQLLADPAICKVFHAAEYDLMCLRRDYQFTVANLFDTMLAARICGIRNVGLHHLVRDYLNVELDKSHQRDNWGERPLNPESLRYAQMDTHYLPRLHDILNDELIARGHQDEAREVFDEFASDERSHEGRSFDPDGFWKIGLPNQLNPIQMAILREVYLERERIAEIEDKPPFKVISTQGLINLARQAPTHMGQFQHIADLSPSLIRRHGKSLIEAVRRGQSATLPPAPAQKPPPTEVSDLYVALHGWRKERALQRGVESDVILSRQALWSLAYQMPTTPDQLDAIRGLGNWKRQQYGDELLALIRQYVHTNGVTPSAKLNGSKPE